MLIELHGDVRENHESSGDILCCGGYVKGLGRVAHGISGCQKAVREELRRGADCTYSLSPLHLKSHSHTATKVIKSMCSGGNASPTDKLESSQYTKKSTP